MTKVALHILEGYDPISSLPTARWAALREAVVYVLFLVIFSVVIFSPRNAAPYELQRYVTDNILEAEYWPNENYKSVTDMNEFFLWFEQIFVPGIYPNTWYNGDAVAGEDAKFTVGGANLRVGLVRLRQLRVRPDSCNIASTFENTILDCYGSFTTDNEETRSYTRDVDGSTSLTFDWKSADELDTFSWFSDYTKIDYSGSGYVVDLPNSYSGALEKVQQLKAARWMDPATRIIFIDFTLYNANIDMFSVVHLLVEVLPSGTVISSAVFRTLPLITPWRVLHADGVDTIHTVVAFFEIVLYLFVLYYVVHEVLFFRLVGWAQYFSSAWNVLEFLNIGLFLATLILRLISWQLISDEMDNMDKDDRYVNLMPISFFAQEVDNVNAFNAVLCFVKLFKYLRSNRRLGQFTDTLGAASGEMVILMFIILILASGYGIAFHMAFGHALPGFRDFPEALFSLFRSTLGDFDLDALRTVNRYLGPILFSTYMILMIFVIISMFLSIVDRAYEGVREEIDNSVENPLTRDCQDAYLLIATKLKAKLGLKLPKLKGMTEEAVDEQLYTPRTRARKAASAGMLSEMTVEMKAQEEEVMSRLARMEEQQAQLRNLLSQISTAVAP